MLPLLLLLACHAPVSDDGTTETTTGDTAAKDTGEEIPWGEGPRAIRGQVWFFDMPTPGVLEVVRDVEGAELFLLDAPDIRIPLDPASEYAFEVGGIPEGAGVVLAVTHPDFFPYLTQVLPVGTEDLENVTFQVVSHTISGLIGPLLEADPADPAVCQMSTTVTEPDADSLWAAGEPGATVTLDPAVSEDQGPTYFNEYVIPDVRRTDTSTDGGVIVVNAAPGTYTWTVSSGALPAGLTLSAAGTITFFP